MAKNKVEIDVKVDDKGSTKKVGLEAKKTAKGLDKTGQAAANADRNMKGVAQTSANSTKNFSKMSQGMGGLVGAYATLAANIFAISAAYGFLKRAGDLAALRKGQEAYALKTGKSMTLLTSRMQEATQGLLGFDEAARAASIGTAAGLSSQQLTGLAKVARNASVSLGVDLTDAFNRVTKGAIKAEPELLDELGIILRLDKATADYARVIGKSADELTTFEKSQAVVNAVLEQGNKKFDDVPDNINQIARLGKAFDDLVKDLMEFINPFAQFFGKALADNVTALAAAFGILGLSITKAFIPAGPAMYNMEQKILDSKAALMGAAGGSTVGKKIAGGDFSSANLNAIDRASSVKSGNSTVVKQYAMNEKAFKRHTAIIRAGHAQMLAQNTIGYGKYYARVIAYFKAMQAEHGKVIGVMKGAVAGLATGMSKALNAVAIIGMISLAITMVKEFIEYFKDPALKAMQNDAKSLGTQLAETDTEVSKLIANFNKSGSASELMIRQANLLSNITFPNVENMTAEFIKAGKYAGSLKAEAVQRSLNNIPQGDIDGGYVEDVPEAVRPTNSNIYKVKFYEYDEENKGLLAYIDKVKQVNKLFTQQTDLLVSMGQATPAVEEQQNRIEAISKALATFEAGPLAGLDRNSTVKERSDVLNFYNEAKTIIGQTILEAKAAGDVLSTALTPNSQAIRDVGQVSEAYEKMRGEMAKTKSQYNQVIEYGTRYADSIAQIASSSEKGQTVGVAFDPAELAAFEKFLGLKKATEEEIKNNQRGAESIAFRSLTLEQARQKILDKNLATRDFENKIELKKLETQEEYLKSIKDMGAIEKKLAAARNKAQITINAITELAAKIDFEASVVGDKADSTAIDKKKQELQVLVEKLRLENDVANILEKQQPFEIQKLVLSVAAEVNAVKKQGLDLDQKSLDLAKEKAALEQAESDRALARKQRDFKNSGALSFVFQDKFNADSNLKAAEDLEEAKRKALAEEYGLKLRLINMEYTLLDAKLALLHEEIMLKATDPVKYTADQARVFLEQGVAVKKLQNQVEPMRTSAVEVAGMEVAAGNKDITDNINDLKDAKAELTDMKLISDSLATSLVSGLSSAFDGLIQGTITAKEAFASMAQSMLASLAKVIADLLVAKLLTSLIGGSTFGDFLGVPKPAAPTGRYGGVMSEGGKLPGYSMGGVAKGAQAGYPAVLHGTEAVVPLPNGRSIPVEMQGNNQNNNVTVNVALDGNGNGKQNSQANGKQGENLGSVIAAAVQKELLNQKRAGGILSPYGA